MPLFQHLTDRRRPGERRSALRGFAVSLAVHAALIVAALLAGKAGYDFMEDAGTPGGISDGPAGGGGGGGGGERVTFFDIAAAPAAGPAAQDALVVAAPEPEPETPPEPEETAPEPVPQPQAPAGPTPTPSTLPASGTGGAGPGEGTGSGGGSGTGQGEGAGSGVGPGSGGGTGGGTGGGVGSGSGPGTGEGRIQPPVPEVLLMPPPRPPRALRGSTLVVRVSIDTRGEVRDVEFRSTGDRGYDRQLRRVAMDWRFRPARDPANRPVAVEYDVRLDF